MAQAPVSNKAPAVYQTVLIKTDELLSNAQRAPEVFSADRVQRPSQLVRGAVMLVRGLAQLTSAAPLRSIEALSTAL